VFRFHGVCFDRASTLLTESIIIIKLLKEHAYRLRACSTLLNDETSSNKLCTQQDAAYHLAQVSILIIKIFATGRHVFHGAHNTVQCQTCNYIFTLCFHPANTPTHNHILDIKAFKTGCHVLHGDCKTLQCGTCICSPMHCFHTTNTTTSPIGNH
jgi:hypothetical protein